MAGRSPGSFGGLAKPRCDLIVDVVEVPKLEMVHPMSRRRVNRLFDASLGQEVRDLIGVGAPGVLGRGHRGRAVASAAAISSPAVTMWSPNSGVSLSLIH